MENNSTIIQQSNVKQQINTEALNQLNLKEMFQFNNINCFGLLNKFSFKEGKTAVFKEYINYIICQNNIDNVEKLIFPYFSM